MEVVSQPVKLVGVKQPRSIHDPPHICTQCNYPIQIYGRLVPCNHIFCYECAASLKTCATCNVTITSVAEVTNPNVCICLFPGCHRSYLSKFSLSEHQRLRNHAPDANPSTASHPKGGAK